MPKQRGCEELFLRWGGHLRIDCNIPALGSGTQMFSVASLEHCDGTPAASLCTKMCPSALVGNPLILMQY